MIYIMVNEPLPALLRARWVRSVMVDVGGTFVFTFPSLDLSTYV